MTLTEREIKMLDLVATGATSNEIAKKLKHTEGTMRVYLHNLYKKLKVRNKTEAAVWWLTQEKTNVVSPLDTGAVRAPHVVQPAKPQRHRAARRA